MNTSKYFYCYSYRLHLFLESLGVRYEKHGINSNSQHEYWSYLKSEKLDKLISEYEKLIEICKK